MTVKAPLRGGLGTSLPKVDLLDQAERPFNPSRREPDPRRVFENVVNNAQQIQLEDKQKFFRKADSFGWSAIGFTIVALLLCGIFGILPYFAVAGGFAAFFGVGWLIHRMFAAIYIAAVRLQTLFFFAAILVAGGAVFGAVGTGGWAFAVSGLAFLTFSLMLWHIHSEKVATLKISVLAPEDNPADDQEREEDDQEREEEDEDN